MYLEVYFGIGVAWSGKKEKKKKNYDFTGHEKKFFFNSLEFSSYFRCNGEKKIF